MPGSVPGIIFICDRYVKTAFAPGFSGQAPFRARVVVATAPPARASASLLAVLALLDRAVLQAGWLPSGSGRDRCPVPDQQPGGVPPS